ncbi:MAG: MoaD/ThiS family protein [Parvibaculum sp.]
MKILYFAWFRDRIGKPEETINAADCENKTIADLIRLLVERGEEYATAFEDISVVHAALDMEEVPLTTPIGKARELAFYPPFTGG